MAAPRKATKENALKVLELAKNIPSELQALKQWVCVGYEKTKDGNWAKIPYIPDTGSRAKCNDPSTWRTFECACDMLLKRCETYLGLEFALTAADDYFVVDLDNCLESDGTIEIGGLAHSIIMHFDTYVEKSQSGKGIHIIGRGKKPEKAKCSSAKNAPGIEVYDKSRLLVITGDIIPKRPSVIASCQMRLDGFLMKWGLDGKEHSAPQTAQPTVDKQLELHTPPPQSAGRNGHLSDFDVIVKAAQAENGLVFTRLYEGNSSDYNNDESSADLALCNYLAFWTQKDAEQIDRIFRKSGLMREKWNRADYRTSTISRAIAGCTDIYRPLDKDTKTSKARKTSKTTSESSESNDDEESNPGANPAIFHPLFPSLTELGNAEWFYKRFSNYLHFNIDTQKWMMWTDKNWAMDAKYKVKKLVIDSLKDMHSITLKLPRSKRNQFLMHIKRSETNQKIESVITLMKCQDGMPVMSSEMDSHPFLFNCQNGTIDLRTGKLLPHDKTQLLSKITQVKYHPDAKAPTWQKFLLDVFKGDVDIIGFVQRMVGYCMTSDTSEESIFVLYGHGQCGKSKFLQIISEIMGKYYTDTQMNTFYENNDNSTNAIAALAGARAVTASEADDTKTFNEALIKKISGQDPVTCRFLHCEHFTYTPTYKILLSTNDVPHFKSQSFAIKRRIKVIPFTQRFHDPKEKKLPVRDNHMIDKLRVEKEGILAWMVRGCLLWQKEGLNVPAVIQTEIDNLFESQDVLLDFLDRYCVIDASACVETGVLYRQYKEYCTMNEIKATYSSPQYLSRNLTKRDGITSKRTKTKRILVGIGFQMEYPELIADFDPIDELKELDQLPDTSEDFIDIDKLIEEVKN